MRQERLIGRFVVEWSKLEGALEDLIWHLLKLDMEIGRHITVRMDAISKIKMARVGKLELPRTLFYQLSPILDQIDNFPRRP